MKLCVLRKKFRKKLKKKGRDQRGEMDILITTNAELSQLVIDCQQKVLETFDSLQAANELSRKLTEERDLAQVKKELQERDHTINNATRQVEDLGKQLADALHAVVLAESRATVAESRFSDLESKFKASQDEASNAVNQDLFPDLSEMFTTDKIFENRESLKDWAKETGQKWGTEIFTDKSENVKGRRSGRFNLRCKQYKSRRCRFELRAISKPNSSDEWTVKVHFGRHNHLS